MQSRLDSKFHCAIVQNKYMKYLLIIIIFFTACNATKQSAKHLNKAFKKDRVYVAKVTRDSFPCTELFRTDTAFVYTDSTVWIDCPDYHTADSGKMVHDTIKFPNKETFKYIKVPVKLPVRTEIITKYIEDSAKIVIAQKEAATVQNDLLKYKGKAQRRGSLIAWLITAVVILTTSMILLIRSKIKL